MSDDDPELEGYEPHEERPLYARRRQRLVQGAAIVGIFLLVVPLVAAQVSIASSSAQNYCAAWVRYVVLEPSTPQARFELFGPSVLGWECYATHLIGGDRFVGSLGIIPGPPELPSGPAYAAPSNIDVTLPSSKTS